MFSYRDVVGPEWRCTPKKCYHVDAGLRNWTEAYHFCHYLEPVTTLAGDKRPSLLFINTTKEYQVVKSYLRLSGSNVTTTKLTTFAWINCDDNQREGYFICNKDITGREHVAPAYWQQGKPDGGSDENCVAMDWRDSSWDDLACNQDHETICQIVLKNI
eukprot:XP_011665715.1 PREDICTED: C-type lectin domain family 3 member A-like [Strongylocentrotus purpuratus]